MKNLTGEQTWLVVVKIRRGIFNADYSNYLVSAKDKQEAIGQVRQMQGAKAIFDIEYATSEGENPALIRGVRFDQNAHLLSNDVLAKVLVLTEKTDET